MTKLPYTECRDCILEREEYGCLYCPVHYQTTIEKGDSLHHKLDNQMYLITQLSDKYIKIESIKGEKLLISNDADTLSKFQLIKN